MDVEILEDVEEVGHLEDEEEEDATNDTVSIFTNYREDINVPGEKHPAQLCEGAGLANVRMPPITHELKILHSGKFKLSAPQYQAVIYATQTNKEFFTADGVNYRKGFLIGDGTGVGKTFTLAGIAYEAMLNGFVMQVLWVVPNKDLINTAKKAVQTMCPKIDCMELSTLKPDDYFKAGIVFATYTYMSSEVNQAKVNEWLRDDFDGMLVLDECHYIKAAHSPRKKSKIGQYFVDLQDNHPNCRVVYSSATAASEPFHLLSLPRLHFWGDKSKCRDLHEFSVRLKKMGVAGMELVCLDMKRRGVFLSRLISFHNVDVETLVIKLHKDYLNVYSKSCEMFICLLQKLDVFCNNVSAGNRTGWIVRTTRSRFHSEMLRYFACLMQSGKIRDVADKIIADYKKEKSFVVTIQHTGESGFLNNGKPHSVLEQILRRIYALLKIELGPGMLYVTKESGLKNTKFELPEGPPSDSPLDAKTPGNEEDDEVEDEWAQYEVPPGNLIQIAHSIGKDLGGSEPTTKKAKEEETGFLYHSLGALEGIGGLVNKDRVKPIDFTWTAERCSDSVTNADLTRLFFELRPFLPINPLDELTERLEYGINEDATDIIANGTGRQFFYVQDEKCWKKMRTPTRDEDVKKFMDKDKRIIIISDASSVGVSLHADLNRENQQERVHFIIEYPWSPEKLVQTLGRTLRTNAASPPLYVIVKTDIPTEKRFLCVIEERMKQMGAICQGQSEASIIAKHMSTNLNSPATVDAINRTIETYHGKQRSLLGMIGVSQCSTDDVEKFITRTFNRLMMLPIMAQKHFFKKMTIEIGKIQAGDGIFSDLTGVDIPSPSCNADVTALSPDKFEFENGTVFLRTFKIDRTLSYHDLLTKIAAEKKNLGLENLPGFYKTALGDVVYVVKQGNKPKEKTYFAPFCREIITGKLPLSFKETVDGIGHTQWKMAVQSYSRIPGCRCRRKQTKCKQGLCTRKAGTVIINVICGSVYNIFEEIETATTRTNSKIRLARVTWSDQENGTQHDVGLVLDPGVSGYLKRELERNVILENHRKAAKEAKPKRQEVSLVDTNMFDD